MNQFYEKNKDKKINHIPLAGTHDSSAYQIIDGNNGNTVIKVLNVMRKVLPCVNKIVEDWTLTQTLDVAEQLELGIRLFDLRVMFDVKQEKFFFAHTLLCIEAEELLNEIKKFAEANPFSLCVLTTRADVKNSTTLTPERAAEFENMTKAILGDHLIVKKDNQFPTLEEAVMKGQQVLFLYKENTQEKDWVWSYDYVDTEWLNTEVDEDLYQQIKEFIETHKDPDKFRYMSLTMSPSSGTVIRDVIRRIFVPRYQPNNLYKMSFHIQEFLDRLVDEKVDLSEMSGYLFDFPLSSTVQTVYGL